MSTTVQPTMDAKPDVGTDRRTAVIVGVLFLIALFLYLIGSLIHGPATGSEDFLERAYPDRSMVTLGVLVEFVAVISIPLIGFFMFPVLRRFNVALALSYVGFRSLEAVFLIAIEGKFLALIDISETSHNAGASNDLGLQALGDSLLAEKDGIFALYVLIFAVGAMIFYAMLHRTQLVPRWLSIWGFVSAAWMMVGNVLIMFDVFDDSSELVEVVFVLALPINELVLALWLIFKGFDQRSAFTGIGEN